MVFRHIEAKGIARIHYVIEDAVLVFHIFFLVFKKAYKDKVQVCPLRIGMGKMGHAYRVRVGFCKSSASESLNTEGKPDSFCMISRQVF